MTALTEGTYISDVLKWEVNPDYSRQDVTVVAGAALPIGTVLAKGTKNTVAVAPGGTNTGNGVATMASTKLGANAQVGTYTLTCSAIAAPTPGVATGAAVAGNTGNGTITAAPTVSAGAKVGVYRLICIEPGTDVGKFTLSDPDGIDLGVVTVAAAYSANGLAFTIADGSTDFASGDSFIITVAAVPGNGGTFQVVSPSGEVLPSLSVGVAYTGHINLTIADGTTDFIVGDTFTVSVAGDGKYYIAAYGATTGLGEACAILLQALEITAGQVATVLLREAIIADHYLTWDASYDSTNKKAVAFGQLATTNIIKAATVV